MFNNSNTYNDDYQEDGYQSDDNSYDNDNDNDENDNDNDNDNDEEPIDNQYANNTSKPRPISKRYIIAYIARYFGERIPSPRGSSYKPFHKGKHLIVLRISDHNTVLDTWGQKYKYRLEKPWLNHFYSFVVPNNLPQKRVHSSAYAPLKVVQYTINVPNIKTIEDVRNLCIDIHYIIDTGNVHCDSPYLSRPDFYICKKPQYKIPTNENVIERILETMNRVDNNQFFLW